MSKTDNYFCQKISEAQFFADLEKAKTIVDNGIEDFFIYAFPSSMANIEYPKNTLLSDLVDVFGEEFVTFIRFAAFVDCGNNGATKDEYQSIRIRRLFNSDKKKLPYIRFFPKDTWICDWRSGEGAGLLMPFIQDKNTSELKWLYKDPFYRNDGIRSIDDGKTTFPEMYCKDMINVMPDYWDIQLAKYRYKEVDILIPLAENTAKYTFKNRDRDEFGVKRHIVHSVKAHKRINCDSDIERHQRGRADITINGEQICIMSTYSFSYEYFEKRKAEKLKHKKKKR